MPGKLKVKIVAGRHLPVMDRASDLTDAFVEVRGRGGARCIGEGGKEGWQAPAARPCRGAAEPEGHGTHPPPSGCASVTGAAAVMCGTGCGSPQLLRPALGAFSASGLGPGAALLAAASPGREGRARARRGAFRAPVSGDVVKAVSGLSLFLADRHVEFE